MSPGRTGSRGRAPLAYAAAATSVAALFTWGVIAERSAGYLAPLCIAAVVVAAVGVAARSRPIRLPMVPLLQLVAAGLVLFTLLTGSLLPDAEARALLVEQWRSALDSSRVFATPVPADAPPIDPLLLAAGLGLLVVVDLVAVTLHRPAAAGLGLLLAYAVPVGLTGQSPAWWLFALTAAGFLVMLHLEETGRLHRWGRVAGAGARRGRVRAVHLRTTGVAVGVLAVGAALLVPVRSPLLDLQVWDFGAGPGSGGEVTLDNPMVDLRRDLLRGPDRPLVRVRTDDPDPGYLRIAALNRFSANEWSSGDRDIPEANTPSGRLPPPDGLSPDTPRKNYRYRAWGYEDFESTWLPTQFPVSSIEADGDWRYDRATMDFLAIEDGLTTAGQVWEMTAIEPEYSAADLTSAPDRAGMVNEELTELPDLDPMVARLTEEITATADSRLAEAALLQEWFRTGGGFVYDTTVEAGNGSDDLVAFLEDRRGYCEQFAATMAVMARELGIPARVAVGFLSPTRTGEREWVYSSHDLHAWPELHFSGHGWVRFEPTPPARAGEVPGYSEPRGAAPEPESTTGPGAAGQEPTAPAEPGSQALEGEDRSVDPGATEEGQSWGWTVAGIGTVLLAVLLLVPRLLRNRRRRRRLAGGPEQAWAEVGATLTDLGLAWSGGTTPRQRQSELDRLTGGEVGGELTRIVRSLEVDRYAPDTYPVAEPGGWADDVRQVGAALAKHVTAADRRRAAWWPRSVFRRKADEEVAETSVEGELLRR